MPRWASPEGRWRMPPGHEQLRADPVLDRGQDPGRVAVAGVADDEKGTLWGRPGTGGLSFLRSESDLKKTTNIAPGGGADRHMHANRHFDGYACIRCSSLARTPFWGGQWDPDFARRPAPVGVGRSIEIRCDGLPPRPAKQCRPGLGLGGGG